ncbi:MAG: triacylglycerol lipase [Ruminococcus sp.]|nr:triacylglycerol lipase [Ruminococcus sp.]
MKRIVHVCETALLILTANLIPLWTETGFGKIPLTIATLLLCGSYLFTLIKGDGVKISDKRLKRLHRGCTLTKTGGIAAAVEVLILIGFFIVTDAGVIAKIFAVVLPVLLIGIVILCGSVRIAANSRQIKLTDHIAMLLFWWLPVVNIFLIRKFYLTAKREYIFEADKVELDSVREASQVCRTKYPVIMVHGIFFRDWQLMNYWGRVPASLKKNGASVFYGNQQSAQSVADSAKELKAEIEKVLADTGAEKVNIIAHSKGGLDSRYAISRLGMADRVATLTTVNTPHRGCDMVDFLLDKIPDNIVDYIAAKYEKIFTVLGDTKPDFLAGVKDLSAERAKAYDQEMPDMPGVSYRSIMTVMNSPKAAGFPLNMGYRLIKKLNGANDGLVWEGSASHGDFRLVKHTGKRGISHGDVIDLMRENIEGFDVREFYVGILKDLKDQGF